MEKEPRENLAERIAHYALSLRKTNKLQLREAIGQALDYFGISDSDQRDEFFGQVGTILGERAKEAKKRKRENQKRVASEEALKHWRAEAERAGFENTEDYLKHLEE